MTDGYASYSNHGPCVDLFAPGSEITAAYTLQGHRSAAAILSGTSMATPHVAGAALQLLQQFPQMKSDDVKRALMCMATTNVIHGLDAYTPNRLLHTGRPLEVEENVRLLTRQIREPAVPIRTVTQHRANFSGFEYDHIGNARHVSPNRVTPDATACLVGDDTPRWNGYSQGTQPPESARVTSTVVIRPTNDNKGERHEANAQSRGGRPLQPH